MKKLSRALICMAALALALCGTAAAAGPGAGDVSVLLNGRPLTFTDAAPKIVGGRTYIPFRAVFTALGFADEDITYQADTRTVRAAGEDLEISMTIGENRVTVVRDGRTTVQDTDAPAFLEGGRTYVPARFAAEAAGCRVGWDGDTRTVIIDDVEAILAGDTETYEVLSKYLDFERQFQEQSYQITGNYTQTVAAGGEEISQTGEYVMHTAGTAFDYTSTVRYTGQLADALPGDVDLELRGDSGTGEFYFRSNALTALQEGGEREVWYQVSLEQAAGLMPPDRMPGLQSGKPVTGKDYMEAAVRQQAQADMTRSAAAILEQYSAMLGDSAFVRQGNSYVSSADLPERGARVTITFTTSNGKVNGYAVTNAAHADGAERTVEQSMRGDVLRLRIASAEDGVSQTMEMTGTYAPSSEKPNSRPEAGAAVMPLGSWTGLGA